MIPPHRQVFEPAWKAVSFLRKTCSTISKIIYIARTASAINLLKCNSQKDTVSTKLGNAGKFVDRNMGFDGGSSTVFDCFLCLIMVISTQDAMKLRYFV